MPRAKTGFTLHPSPLRHARREGQAVVLVAMAFVLLVAALGLGIDSANAFGQRRLANNAADAASLAATRLLVAERISGTGTPINVAIEEYLTGANGIEAEDVEWEAFYVSRDNLVGSLGAVTDGALPPAGADGVRIEVQFAVPTYFMAAFGQRTLNVAARGTSVFGPLGTAVGQDLAPLALSESGRERLMSEGVVRIDLGGELTSDPPLRYLNPVDPGLGFAPAEIPADVITFDDLRHVSFADTNLTPLVGSDCAAASAVNSLSYWWCKGSPNMLRIGRELPEANMDSMGGLRTVINWRRTNRDILVLPVYTDSIRVVSGSPEVFRELRNFVAVRILSFGSDSATGDARVSPYPDILRVEWVRNYGTSGAMVGEGSATEVTELWAVNLVR
jgi:hypothetical protein